MRHIKVTGNAAQVCYLQIKLKSLLLLYILFTLRKVGYKMIKAANLEAASPFVIFYKVVLVQDTGCGVHQIHPASLQQRV